MANATYQVEAQTVTNLVPFNHSWRYDQTGRELGTAWRGINYTPDAQWQGPSPALFGFDDTAAAVSAYNLHATFPATPLTISSTITTYYFRTTFFFSGATNHVTLIASNLVDDGCAIWLNGRLAGGLRMPTSSWNATNLFGNQANEGALESLTLTNFLIPNQQNTLAVEVHQSSVGSSDAVFGLKLLAFTTNVLAITNHPQSQTVVAGQPFTLSVGVSGGPVSYRWQKDGVNLPSSSNTLSFASATPGSAGNYIVIVSNVITPAITSSVATITVLSDTTGPELVEAIINSGVVAGSNYVQLKFDEPVVGLSANTPVRNTNNYRLVLSSNPNIQIPITNIVYSTATNLQAVLYVDAGNPNWSPTGSYYLVVNNVADVNGNNINPNSVIGVSYQINTNIAQMSAHWDYYANAFFDPGWPAIYRDGSWARTNYVVDPTYWNTQGSDVGIYWFDGNGAPVVCAGDSLGRQISFQEQPTLFRRTFQLPGNFPRTAAIRVRYLVDDGFVLYLNGVEVARPNMPPGALTENSRASTTIANPTCVSNLTIAVSNLIPGGTNWLAAAVHQGPDSENDTYFGLELDAVVLNTSSVPTNRAPGTPTIVRSVQPGKFILSWPSTNYGYALKYSTDIVVGTGPNPARNWWTNEANWIQVKDQSNPYTNNIPPTNGPRRFYKLYREKLN